MDTRQMPADAAGMSMERLRHECICVLLCPTDTPCAAEEHELLYCFAGRRLRCITKDRDCICTTCPVAEQFGLEFILFCTNGSERSLRANEGPAEAFGE
jgi:hypothetical protein